MEQSMQASRNGVAFRRPTFNPGRVVKRMLKGLVRNLELMGRAKAAAELNRMGYHEQAKELMLGMVSKERT
jgi:hypothetical protein